MATGSKTAAAIAEARAAAADGYILPGHLPLSALDDVARGCRACPLYKGANQTVFGAGPGHAGLMLVGEQPGDEEDKQGKPFVGPAGRVLMGLLADVGLERRQIYLTNAVKHFKFIEKGKRRLHQSPKSFEVGACKPWLLAEIDRVQPKVIMALGAIAALSLYGRGVSVTRDRGRPLASPLAPVCLVTFHPSAALRGPTPADRERIRDAVRNDLSRAKDLLTGGPEAHAAAP